MHLYYIKRPHRDDWEPATLTIACLIAKGLKNAPHIYAGWDFHVEFVRDLAEHELQRVFSHG